MCQRGGASGGASLHPWTFKLPCYPGVFISSFRGAGDSVVARVTPDRGRHRRLLHPVSWFAQRPCLPQILRKICLIGHANVYIDMLTLHDYEEGDLSVP